MLSEQWVNDDITLLFQEAFLYIQLSRVLQ